MPVPERGDSADSSDRHLPSIPFLITFAFGFSYFAVLSSGESYAQFLRGSHDEISSARQS